AGSSFLPPPLGKNRPSPPFFSLSVDDRALPPTGRRARPALDPLSLLSLLRRNSPPPPSFLGLLPLSPPLRKEKRPPPLSLSPGWARSGGERPNAPPPTPRLPVEAGERPPRSSEDSQSSLSASSRSRYERNELLPDPWGLSLLSSLRHGRSLDMRVT